MDVLRLIGGIVLAVGAVIAVAAIIEYLSYEKVISWFQKHEPLLEEDKDRVGLLFLEHLSNGNYRTITGVFDTVTEEVVAREVVDSRNVDSRVKEACREGYAIYTIAN